MLSLLWLHRTGSDMPYAEALTIKKLFDAGAYPGIAC